MSTAAATRQALATREVRLVTTLEASDALAFRSWTDAALVARWWNPRGTATTDPQRP